jgi:hypothetical protein
MTRPKAKMDPICKMLQGFLGTAWIYTANIDLESTRAQFWLKMIHIICVFVSAYSRCALLHHKFHKNDPSSNANRSLSKLLNSAARADDGSNRSARCVELDAAGG